MKIGEPSIFTGAKRRLIEIQDSFQYVPLLSSLHALLNDPTIINEIDQCPSRVHTDGMYVMETYLSLTQSLVVIPLLSKL